MTNELEKEYQITLLDGSRYVVTAKSSVEAVLKLKRRLNKDFITAGIRVYQQVARKQ